MLSGNAGMTVAVLPTGGVFMDKKKKKMIDANHFHVYYAHVHSSVLKATALQYGIQLVGELAPCSGCSMAKGIHALTLHDTTSRAAAPVDMVHIHTVGPFQESLGGSRCVVMFVDSASRFHNPFGPGTRAHVPFSVWRNVLWPRWEFREHSGRTVAPIAPTRRSSITVTASESASN